MNSDYETRVARCARVGHATPVKWWIRWRGRLWLRLLCPHCCVTTDAVHNGARASS